MNTADKNCGTCNLGLTIEPSPHIYCCHKGARHVDTPQLASLVTENPSKCGPKHTWWQPIVEMMPGAPMDYSQNPRSGKVIQPRMYGRPIFKGGLDENSRSGK